MKMNNNNNNNNDEDNLPGVNGDHGETGVEEAVNAGNNSPNVVSVANQAGNEVQGTVVWSPTETTILEIAEEAKAAANRMDGWSNLLFANEKLPEQLVALLNDPNIPEETQLCFKVQGLDTGRKLIQFARRGIKDNMDAFPPSNWANESFCIFLCVVRSITKGHTISKGKKWESKDHRKRLQMNRVPNCATGSNVMFQSLRTGDGLAVVKREIRKASMEVRKELEDAVEKLHERLMHGRFVGTEINNSNQEDEVSAVTDQITIHNLVATSQNARETN